MKKLMSVILFLAFASVGSSVMAQKVCTKQVDDTAVKLYIRNATEKAFTVHYVDENCKESPSDEKIEPGRAFIGDTHNGHAFRVREDGTNKLLQEVVADPSNTTVTVGLVKNSDARQGFLETLNRVRRGRNLAPMEFDDSLNQACQWFADLMAKFDKGGHDAVEVGGNSYKDMQEPWMRVKKFNYKGDGGTEATAEGDYNDVSIIGSDAMMGWSSSDTHFRPFLSMDNQIFKHVGFGYAKSAKKPNYYYTCAVFGNPSEGGGNTDSQPNNNAADKEPIKTDVPEGLKFKAAKFFQMQNGKEKYGTSFSKNTLDELQAEFSFENPSSQPFNVEAKTYLNGKVISSESLKDLKGSGAMSILVAGESGQKGKVAAGKYRFEILLNGEVVLSAEATVK
jgi:uncharacterized protein YkwD